MRLTITTWNINSVRLRIEAVARFVKSARPDDGGWVDAMRMLVPEPTKLYTWWSYRSLDWQTADKGRRLDHIWVAPALADRFAGIEVMKQLRGSSRPSNHVPVTATLAVSRCGVTSVRRPRGTRRRWRSRASPARADRRKSRAA